MGERVQVVGQIISTPDGAGQGETATLDFSDAAAGGSFTDSRGRKTYQLSTTGTLGSQFVALDAPNVVQSLFLWSRGGSEMGVRLNGAPAKVTGAGASFGTIVNTDTLTLVVDAGSLVTVNFLTGDVTIALVIARINAAMNAIVASNDGNGNLVLTGARTGDFSAFLAAMQYGLLTVGGNALAKLGLTAGSTYGAGRDFRINGRLFVEFPASGGVGQVSKVEMSGTGELLVHAVGRAS